MFDEYFLFDYNGYTFYIDKDDYYNLQFINNRLVNISNTNITLRYNFDTINGNTYPYISCPASASCRYVISNGNQSYVTSSLPNRVVLDIYSFVLLLLLGVFLIWKR